MSLSRLSASPSLAHRASAPETQAPKDTEPALADVLARIEKLDERVRFLLEATSLRCKLLLHGGGELQDELFTATYVKEKIRSKDIDSTERARLLSILTDLRGAEAYMIGLEADWIDAALRAQGTWEEFYLIDAASDLCLDDEIVSLVEDFALRK